LLVLLNSKVNASFAAVFAINILQPTADLLGLFFGLLQLLNYYSYLFIYLEWNRTE